MSPLNNPVTRSYTDKLMSDRDDYFEQLKEYRRYDANDQPTQLNDAQKTLLDENDGFNINICSTINTTEVDRLEVQRLEVSVPEVEVDAAAKSDDVNEPLPQRRPDTETVDRGTELTELATLWWQQSRMDAGQRNQHYAAARDGDSYQIVEYDSDKQHPVFFINWAYDGDSGVDMVYVDGDPNQPIYSVKRWTSKLFDVASGTRERRMNIYLPDRTLKFINTKATTSSGNDWGWQAYLDEDTLPEPMLSEIPGQSSQMAGVVWWTDTKTEDGTPLGIPVFPFRHSANGNAYGTSNLADIVPDLQDSINLGNASYMMAAQLAGFNTVFYAGVEAIEADKIKVVPGSINAASDPAASATVIPATDLEALGKVVDREMRYASMLTATPMPMLNPSSQVAAEGTLQQQEAPLLAKVRGNQVAYGNSYEDAMKMAFRLDAVFGNKAVELDAVDELSINCEWKDPQTRNELAEIAVLVQKYQQLGVPWSQIMREAGYDEPTIDAMEKERAESAALQEATDNAQAAQIALALGELSNGTAQPGGNGASNPEVAAVAAS